MQPAASPATTPSAAPAPGPTGRSARTIDGKAIAAALTAEIGTKVGAAVAAGRRPPGLAVVLVGGDPASHVYVSHKGKATIAAGMRSFEHRLPETASEAELLALVASLNADPAVDGILVQLPLPAHLDARRVTDAIDPAKDVDGFHPVNVGRLSIGVSDGRPLLVPCTPAGCMRLIRSVRTDLAGLEAVVVGRSNIVGKPIAQLLLAADCTVTVAHSKSRDLPALCRRADILIAGVGRPELIRGDWIKPGAIVIDVGINRVPGREPGKTRLVGDVATAEAAEVAGWITPVPGGVGPMTIAGLLDNTWTAYQARQG
jgi:methylenetetrahydrofolate dehydrogenase (NADP+)/methenyltetrahydrofolate cyclohydrolase